MGIGRGYGLCLVVCVIQAFGVRLIGYGFWHRLLGKLLECHNITACSDTAQKRHLPRQADSGRSFVLDSDTAALKSAAIRQGG
jgi:hypothetical protein